jgi:murein DD-endopeptidase MepM/ murein hydrolase activator NlpD
MRMLALITLCVVALAPRPASSAAGDCDDDWICVRVEESPAGIVLSGRNLSAFPLTLTVRVRGTGLVPPAARTVTRTLDGGTATELMRVPAAGGGRYRYRYWYEWTVGDAAARHDDAYLYRLPYARGESFRVLQGYASDFSHTGLERYAVDFDMPEGTPVHAARGGVVARTEDEHDIGCWDDGCGRYANYIVILHDDGTTGEYYHLRQGGVLVEPGTRVEAGDLIGLSGNTGHTTMAHLHFAVYRAGEWGRTESLPVRYAHRDGVTDWPRHGQRLVAR